MPLYELYEIFRAQPRYTEPTERRQAIQAKTERENKKNKENKPGTEDTLFGDDRMSVSVLSLKAFFKSLLAGQTTTETPPAEEMQEQQQDEQEARATTEPPTARAAQAYQHASETAPNKTAENIERGTEGITQDQSLQAPPLSKVEQDKIYDLLIQLDKLTDKQIEHITLQPAASFLGSVEKTVQQYL